MKTQSNKLAYYKSELGLYSNITSAEALERALAYDDAYKHPGLISKPALKRLVDMWLEYAALLEANGE